MSLITDFRYAFRSLARAKGLVITVVVTLALGIGANAAIFSVVRGVLLRPLVNRDEDRLIYIRQSAQGLGQDSVVFSVPEIQDLRARVTTLTAFGEFSTIPFTMVGLGEPRVVRAGVVSGSYFDVMGLRPVLGRLLGPADDGPKAAGAAVLTHRFWTTTFKGDRSVIGKTVRFDERIGHHRRRARAVGALSGRNGDHRQRRHQPAPSLGHDGDRPRAPDDRAVRPPAPWRGPRGRAGGTARRSTPRWSRRNPESYPKKGDFRIDAVQLRDQISSPARTVLLVLLAASGLVFIIACSNVANLILARSVRREGELAIRATLGASAGALRRTLLAESLLLCGAGAILGVLLARPMVALLARYAARFSVRALELTVDASLLWVGVGLALAAAVLLAFVPRLPSAEAAGGLGVVERRRADHVRHEPAAAALRRDADRRVVRAAGRRRHAADDAVRAAGRADDVPDAQRAGAARTGHVLRADAGPGHRLLPGSDPAHLRAARRRAGGGGHAGAVAGGQRIRSRLPAHRRGARARRCRRRSARAVPDGIARVLRRARRARCSPAATSATPTAATASAS